MVSMGGHMQFRYWVLSLLVMLPLILAFGKGDAAKGKAVYGRCAICHGDAGEGKEAIAKALGVKMPALYSNEVQSLDDATLKKSIVEGKGKMQAVKLSDADAEDIIAFIRSLKKPSAK
jgi:mono/diheme cytochrome c family protein